MSPADVYDLIIRVRGYTGHWDEKRRGFVIPMGYDSKALAEQGAVRLIEEIEVGIVPSGGEQS